MFYLTKTQVTRGQKYCSNVCYQQHRVRNGFNTVSGYHMVWDGERYVAEHRLVVERSLGRKLHNKEEVHHIDGNRLNNDIRNLAVFINKSEHRTEHCKVRHVLTYRKVVCHECGKTTSIKLSRYIKNKSGMFFCSLPCALKNRTLTMKYIWEQRRKKGTSNYGGIKK
jgi:predicted metal-binding protein